MPHYAILDPVSGMVVPCELHEWAEWLEKSREHRVIAQDYFLGGALKLSTVFLGLNHQFNPSAPPLWFETMSFGPKRELRTTQSEKSHPWFRDALGVWRYTTLEEAKLGHQRAWAWLAERIDRSNGYQLLLP